MKRSKTNLVSNDKPLKPHKKLKAVMASDGLSLSNEGPDKEVSSTPVGKTKRLVRGRMTPAKQTKSVELKCPVRKLSAGSRGPEALLKAAGDSPLTTTPNTVKGRRVNKKISSPVVMGLQCKSVTASRSKKSMQLILKSSQNVGEPEAPQLDFSLVSKTTDSQDKETDGDASTKRKWGRTFTRKPANRQSFLASNHENGDASVKKLPNRSGLELALQQEESIEPVKRKRGRRPMVSLNMESSPQVFEDSSAQEENGNSDIVVKESLNTVSSLQALQGSSAEQESENQPLSRWSASLKSAGKNPAENVKSAPSVTKGSDQNLSFEKENSFWEGIKSMDAFRVFPQNPHFQPLDNLKKTAREREASHKMVDFSTVFDMTRRIQYDHPKAEIEDQLEILSDLEANGFDVGPLRTRLMKVLLLKDELEVSETGLKEEKNDIGNERVRIQERNREIALIDRQTIEMSVKRERLAKENEEGELKIVAWEDEAVVHEIAKRECLRKFDDLLSTPL